MQAFAQTPDRYLWIGTTGGLLRFDGARFTLFDQENTPELRGNSVFSLLASRDGSLWIGTEGAGLLRYQAGKFRRYGSQDGLSDSFVRALYEDRGGTIWVGTDNGLLRFVAGRLQRVDGTQAMPAIAVHSIAEDHLGGLWVGGSRLLRIEKGDVREYLLKDNGSQNRVKSIVESADHNVWVGTVSGLHRLRPGSQTFEPVPEFKGTVRVLRQTTDGTLWVGMIGHGILTMSGERFKAIRAPDALPSNTVLNVFEDDERNVWIGTQAGLLRLTRTPVRIVPLPRSADSDFGTIYADHDGSLWVVSTKVFHMRGDAIEPYVFPGLSHVPVRNLFRDRAGALWIGTDGEGIIRTGGKKMLWMTTRDGLVNNFIRAVVQSRDGSMWIATDEGLSHWTPHGFANYQMRDGLSYFSTRALLEDRNGDLWIGTDRGLNRLHRSAFMHDDVTERLKQEKVWAIHEDADGGLWFGTRNDGLYRWRQKKLTHFTTEQGLASNSIYQIVEDQVGGFWISGPNGISLLSRRELDGVADRSAQHLSLTLYGISSELETTQIYGGRQPSGCIDAHGDVWFPSDRGPIHITRNTPQIPHLSRTVISQVFVNGSLLPADQPIVIGPGNSRLEIAYAPILLRSQDGIRFRYKLDGFDSGWTDASTRRSASYTNLPPGKYDFHVVAFDINDPEVVSETSLIVLERPQFYRTPSFVIVCVLLVAALIFAIYRFRLWQIRVRFEAMLEERNRVAREMHDTVIQGCASVSALLEALSSLSPPENHVTNELIEYARTQVRSTIDEARQSVWNLRQKNPSENALGPAVERMAGQISKESGIPISFQPIGRPFVLNEYATHELLMMAREALYNAVQHASPARIDIILRFAKKDVTLEVTDNGSGFDPALIRPRNERHFGLVGMRERVQCVGGQFRLESAPGVGTGVKIQIPRRVSAAQKVMLSA